MKDTKSEGTNTKFYASFRNRKPGSPACWIEVTVMCRDRKEAKRIARREVAALTGYTFEEID